MHNNIEDEVYRCWFQGCSKSETIDFILCRFAKFKDKMKFYHKELFNENNISRLFDGFEKNKSKAKSNNKEGDEAYRIWSGEIGPGKQLRDIVKQLKEV